MRTKLLAASFVSVVLSATSALAQTTSLPGKDRIVGKPQDKAAVPPPPAVPGAVARPGTVAPADRNAADLAPTEALFDAINRGDITTARDAIARGADIDATNLLGLTPLELSVDLSRNDITFLLLSFRGGSGRGSMPSPQTGSTQQAKVATPVRKLTKRENAIGVAAVEAPQPVRQTPALYAGNGGNAIPAAGFLGFDAKH